MTDSTPIPQESTQEHEQEDRLSKLPDDVLILILDKLKLLSDAVRTCVLSKRWRHLVGLLSEIVLDVAHYQPRDVPSSYTLQELVQANVSVVNAAKSILAHKSQHAITYLSIRFYLRDESIDIVHSVDSAMAGRGVDRAEFKIISEMGDESCTHHDKITYGRRFLTFLDSYPRAFGGLTDLIIYNLRLGVSDIPNVLGTCKKLEYLYLQNCDAGIRSVIQIEHSQLAELVIVACPFERIELKWLPQLTHLTCQTWLPSRDSSCPLSFGYVPQLWALILTNMASTFHHNVKLSELLRNSVIRKLELDFQSKKIYIQPEGPKRLAPLLKNLETVILRFVHEDWHLTWTMFFLEAAPLLKEINIHVWGHDCNSNEGAMYKLLFQKTSDDHLIWEARNDFKHYNLSKLIIEGYQVEEKFTRYIRQVMESAVNLVLLSLLQSRLCANCGFCPSTAYPQTDQERERIKMQISEWRSSPIKIEFGI